MKTRFFFAEGERWIVKEGLPSGVRTVDADSYISETPPSYSILFAQPTTGEKRQTNWPNPISKCTTEDFQLMLESARPV